jgi:excinuclease UvrABC helicase subunit UvrB
MAPALPALIYARQQDLFAEAVRFGYSCEHRLDVGPCQMRLDSVHIFPYNDDENRCRVCVLGACVQRVELWPEGLIVVVHDCRSELS